MLKRLVAGLISAALLLTGGMPAYADLATAPAAVTAQSSAGLPAAASLGPLIWISQTMNNCGPASIAEVLDYWGIHKTQGEVQAVLRADGNRGGMTPFGIPAYARSLGMRSLMGAGGTDAVIKRLIAAGLPVIVSQWVSLTDHYGHYRAMEGYDDSRGVFVASDSYLGPNHQIGYDEFDKIWAANNNRFYVIFPPAKQGQVDAALASAGWNQTSALLADITVQQARLDRGQSGPAGWMYRRGYSALTIAWDNLQYGDLAAAQRALDQATVNGANAVVTGWIAGEITYREQSAAAS